MVFQNRVFLSRHCPISHIYPIIPTLPNPRAPAGGTGVGYMGDNGVYIVFEQICELVFELICELIFELM